MSELRVASINNPSAGSGGLAISAAGNVTGAGLDLIVTQSFSAVASISLDNVFTGDYDNYRIIVPVLVSEIASLELRMRLSGTDATTNYERQRLTAESTTVTASRASRASMDLTTHYTGYGLTTLEIASPYLARATNIMSLSINSQPSTRWYGGQHTTATAYDGFTIYPGDGTITGTISVYGYKS